MARVLEEKPQNSAVLAKGPLVLEVHSRILSSPEKSTLLTAAEMAIIHPLMRHAMLTAMDLESDTSDPFNVRIKPAIRMRIMRAKRAIERVGVDGDAVRGIRGLGYYLTFRDGPDAQVFSGERLRLLERILRTHPNKALVAQLEA